MLLFRAPNRKSNSKTKKCVKNVNAFAFDLTKIYDCRNVYISCVSYYFVHFFMRQKLAINIVYMLNDC